MDLGIEGLRVLITAGAGGIGLKVAEAFEREGARVHVCDIDRTALAALAKSRPGISASECDVADRQAVAALFKEAIGKLGGLDCLVNNAGIAGPTDPCTRSIRRTGIAAWASASRASSTVRAWRSST